MIIKTRNFHPDIDTKLVCTCSHPDCNKQSVTQDTLERVQVLRDIIDRPLTITSGGRCGFHPDELKRSKKADHQKGIAVDIGVYGGAERAEVVKLALELGFNAIGVGGGFVHIGFRKGETLVMWSY